MENFVSQVPPRRAPSASVLSDVGEEGEVAVSGNKQQIHIQSQERLKTEVL